MHLLIVDDLVVFRDTYLLRIFSQLLPISNWEIDKVSSIEEAVPLISSKDYDVILMDYSLGKGVVHEAVPIKNGADLVKLRRRQENLKAVKKSIVVGNASTMVGNAEISKAGGNRTFHKLKVEELAQFLGTLPKKEKAQASA